MKRRKLLLIFAIFSIILTTFSFNATANAARFNRIGNFETQNLWSGFNNGVDADRQLSITILAEGYTASEQSKFISDAQSCVNHFLATSPYNEFTNYINVHAVKIVSQESGIPNNPGRPYSYKNFFQTRVDWQGYLIPYYNNDFTNYYCTPEQLALSYFPETNFTVLLCNTDNAAADSNYMKSSGTFALRSGNSSPSCQDIFTYGLGRFLGLEDEFYPKIGWYIENGWNNDKTNDLTNVKWRWFKDFPGVSAFSIGNNMYKPCQNCVMNCSGYSEYDPVCKYLVRRNLIANIFSSVSHDSEKLINVDIGDVNMDGCVDNKDYTSMQGFLTNMTASNDAQMKISDVNGDGCFDSKDSTILESYLSGSNPDINNLFSNNYYIYYANGRKVKKLSTYDDIY